MSPGLYDWYIKGWSAVENWVAGTNVFEKEWDVSVLLDCARPDMLAAVSDEYQQVGSGETLQSVTSCSVEWLQKTFREHHSNQLSETAPITANPNTDTVDGVDLLADLLEGWDTEEETVPPWRVTDAAIQYAREATSPQPCASSPVDVM